VSVPVRIPPRDAPPDLQSAYCRASRVGKQNGPALHARPAPGLASLGLSMVDAECIIRGADAGTSVDRVIFLPLAQLPIPDIGWRDPFAAYRPSGNCLLRPEKICHLVRPKLSTAGYPQ
jgi:hypothetical protein